MMVTDIRTAFSADIHIGVYKQTMVDHDGSYHR